MLDPTFTQRRRRGRNPLRDPRDRCLNRVVGLSSLVLFGVTGDLARKKLMPPGLTSRTAG